MRNLNMSKIGKFNAFFVGSPNGALSVLGSLTLLYEISCSKSVKKFLLFEIILSPILYCTLKNKTLKVFLIIYLNILTFMRFMLK